MRTLASLVVLGVVGCIKAPPAPVVATAAPAPVPAPPAEPEVEPPRVTAPPRRPAPAPANPFAAVESMLRVDPTLRLRHEVAYGEPALTLLGTERATTLCVTDTGERWQRCFEGDWQMTAAYDVAAAGERVCVEIREGAKTTALSFGFEEGPVERGCGEGAPPRPPPRSTSVGPVSDVYRLFGLTIVPLGAGSAMMHDFELEGGETKERLCVHGPQGLACESPRVVDTEGVIELRYGALAVVSDGEDTWGMVERSSVADGGVEVWRGEQTLLLFSLDAGQLALHGVLPIGGYEGERFGDGYPDFVSVTHTLHSATRLRARGCVVVTTKGKKLARVPKRKPKTSRWGAPRAEEAHSGEDVGIWNRDDLRDFAGAWMPRTGGGFERVARCPSGG